jgi:hypothetical protein
MNKQETIDALERAMVAICQVEQELGEFDPRKPALEAYRAGKIQHDANAAYWAIHTLATGLEMAHHYPEPTKQSSPHDA